MRRLSGLANMSKQKRLLIVGAGPTGALLSHLLRSESVVTSPSEADASSSPITTAPFKINVWDKARGPGGRFSTSYSNINSSFHADLGAQYLTEGAGGGGLDLSDESDGNVSTKILKRHLVKIKDAEVSGDRSPKGTNHYYAPNGLSGLVKDLITSSVDKDNITYSRRVAAIDANEDGSKNVWTVTDTEGKKETFDLVALTLPVPQILELEGNFLQILEKQSVSTISGETKTAFDMLSTVQYSSRWAFAYYYNTSLAKLPEWTGRYVKSDEDPCIRWISLETNRRHRDPIKYEKKESGNGGTVIVVHCSVPWTLANYDEPREQVAESVSNRLKDLDFIPGFEALGAPFETKILRWKYSQVTRGTEVESLTKDKLGSLGVCPTNDKTSSPTLFLAGDSFTGSNYENCLRSALATHKGIKAHL
eukprot:g2423.t1